MAWCRQATSHYLSQCWPRSMSPYGVTRPQWIKKQSHWMMHCRYLSKKNMNVIQTQLYNCLLPPWGLFYCCTSMDMELHQMYTMICDYLSMSKYQTNSVNKRGPWRQQMGLCFWLCLYIQWGGGGVVVYGIFSCDQAALRTLLSVCLSVCHTFLTLFLSSYHPEFSGDITIERL